MNRTFVTLLLAFLLMLSIVCPAANDPQPQQDSYDQILHFLHETKPVPQKSNWAVALSEMLTALGEADSKPDFFYSEPLAVLLITIPNTESILFVVNKDHNFQAQRVPLIVSSQQLARSIWETKPNTRLKTDDASTMLPIQTEDFADLLVIETFPFPLDHQAVSLFRNAKESEKALFLFDNSKFKELASHTEERIYPLTGEETADSRCKAESFVALRYCSLLYGFSYQITLESIRSFQSTPSKDSPEYLPTFLSYLKLLSQGCKTDSPPSGTLFNLKPEQLLYSTLGMIHHQLREKDSDSPEALLFWTLMQKSWMKPSLIQNRLEFDLEIMIKKLPDFLNQMENMLLSGLSYEKPAKYSYRYIEHIVDVTSR